MRRAAPRSASADNGAAGAAPPPPGRFFSSRRGAAAPPPSAGTRCGTPTGTRGRAVGEPFAALNLGARAASRSPSASGGRRAQPPPAAAAQPRGGTRQGSFAETVSAYISAGTAPLSQPGKTPKRTSNTANAPPLRTVSSDGRPPSLSGVYNAQPRGAALRAASASPTLAHTLQPLPPGKENEPPQAAVAGGGKLQRAEGKPQQRGVGGAGGVRQRSASRSARQQRAGQGPAARRAAGGGAGARSSSISRESNAGFEAVEQLLRSPPHPPPDTSRAGPARQPAGAAAAAVGGAGRGVRRTASPATGRLDKPRCKPALPLAATPGHSPEGAARGAAVGVGVVACPILASPPRQGGVERKRSPSPCWSPGVEQRGCRSGGGGGGGSAAAAEPVRAVEGDGVAHSGGGGGGLRESGSPPPADLSAFLRQFEEGERARERALRRDLVLTQHQFLREVDERAKPAATPVGTFFAGEVDVQAGQGGGVPVAAVLPHQYQQQQQQHYQQQQQPYQQEQQQPREDGDFPIKTSARAAAILERLKRKDTAAAPEAPSAQQATPAVARSLSREFSPRSRSAVDAAAVTPPRAGTAQRESLLSPEVLRKFEYVSAVVGSGGSGPGKKGPAAEAVKAVKAAGQGVPSDSDSDGAGHSCKARSQASSLVEGFRRRSDEIRKRMAASWQSFEEDLSHAEGAGTACAAAEVVNAAPPPAAARRGTPPPAAVAVAEPPAPAPAPTPTPAPAAPASATAQPTRPRLPTASAVRTRSSVPQRSLSAASRSRSPSGNDAPVCPTYPASERPGCVSAAEHRSAAQAEPDPSKPLPAHKDPRAWQAGIAKSFTRRSGKARRPDGADHPGHPAPGTGPSFRIGPSGLFSDVPSLDHTTTAAAAPSTPPAHPLHAPHRPAQWSASPPQRPHHRAATLPPGTSPGAILCIQRCWRKVRWMRTLRQRCRARAERLDWRMALRIQKAVRSHFARKKVAAMLRERHELEEVMLELTRSIRETAFKKQMKRRAARKKERQERSAALTREIPSLRTTLRAKQEACEHLTNDAAQRPLLRHLEMEAMGLASDIRQAQAEVDRLADDDLFEREMEEEEAAPGPAEPWQTLSHRDREYLKQFMQASPLLQTAHFREMFQGLLRAVETGDARHALPSQSPRNKHLRHIIDAAKHPGGSRPGSSSAEPADPAAAAAVAPTAALPPRSPRGLRWGSPKGSPPASPRSSPAHSSQASPRLSRASSIGRLRRSPSARDLSRSPTPQGRQAQTGRGAQGGAPSRAAPGKLWQTSLHSVMGSVEDAFAAAAELTDDWEGGADAPPVGEEVVAEEREVAVAAGEGGDDAAAALLRCEAEAIVAGGGEGGDVPAGCDSETVSECFASAMEEIRVAVSPQAVAPVAAAVQEAVGSPKFNLPHRLVPTVAKASVLMAAALSLHLTYHCPPGDDGLAQFAPAELAAAFAPTLQEV